MLSESDSFSPKVPRRRKKKSVRRLPFQLEIFWKTRTRKISEKESLTKE